MPESILSRQNDIENIELLQASSAAYKGAKRGEIFITYVLLFLSVGYPACYLFVKNYNFILALSGCSFLLTIFIQIFSVKFKGNTAKGAIFKEKFDTNVFGLPWKSTLKPPDKVEVLRLSRKYKGREIRNWYSTNLSEKLEHNTAVAVLQHSNTSWDISLRKLYRKYLIWFLIVYAIVLSFCFLFLLPEVLTIFLLLFSLMSFFTHFIILIRGHSDAILKRETISSQLDKLIRGKIYISINLLRDIQDEIYLTRQESAKVPDFFFRRYQSKLNSEAEKYIEEINKLYV